MTKTLNEIVSDANAHASVYSASVWQDRRVYINFAGRNTNFAGDRNLKVYFDINSGWRVDGVKGCMSSAFGANARKFLADMGVTNSRGGSII